MYRWTVNLKGAPQLDPNGAAVSVRHKVYYFAHTNMSGRMRQTRRFYVHVFNTVSLRWKEFPPVTPGRELFLRTPIYYHSQTAVLIDDMVYLWGGFCYTSEHLHAFDVDTHRWFRPKTSGNVPEPREKASACALGKVMFIYGGYSYGDIGHTEDLYKLDTTTMVWSLINTSGIPPSFSSGDATVIGTKMFVFDGEDHITTFDTETNCWLSKPSGQLLSEEHRSYSAFPHNGEPLGVDNFKCYFYHYYYGLSKFNPETTSWKKVEPKGIGQPQMYWFCSCMVGDRMIVFGQSNGDPDGDRDHTCILDFSPSLKTLCKLSVIQHGLEQSELPQDIRWELAAMTSTNGNSSKKQPTKKKKRNRTRAK